MTSSGPSLLSVTAGVFYCVVAVLCCMAAARAAHAGQTAPDRRQWIVCCSLFILFAISRWLDLEHGVHDAVRALFEKGGLYHLRQAIQVPLAALAMLCSVLAAWYWLKRWLVVRNYQSGRYLHIAQAAAAGMIALICLRMISWHQSDLLLYGWRLNWIIDPALSLIVGWSALRYRVVTKISNHPE